MLKICAVKVPKFINKTKYNNLFLQISKYKHENTKNYSNIRDSYRNIIGETLMIYMYLENRDFLENQFEISYDCYGKPFIPTNHQIFFNISHSGDWVTCAIDSSPVGIDIELVQNIELDNINHFFSSEEYKQLTTKKSSLDKVKYFYELWTLKESYFKATGRGIFLPLNRVHIETESNNLSLFFNNKTKREPYFLKTFQITNTYIASVCAVHNIFPNKISKVDFSRLYQKITELS